MWVATQGLPRSAALAFIDARGFHRGRDLRADLDRLLHSA
jgi:hypothetical protein